MKKNEILGFLNYVFIDLIKNFAWLILIILILFLSSCYIYESTIYYKDFYNKELNNKDAAHKFSKKDVCSNPEESAEFQKLGNFNN